MTILVLRNNNNNRGRGLRLMRNWRNGLSCNSMNKNGYGRPRPCCIMRIWKQCNNNRSYHTTVQTNQQHFAQTYIHRQTFLFKNNKHSWTVTILLLHTLGYGLGSIHTLIVADDLFLTHLQHHRRRSFVRSFVSLAVCSCVGHHPKVAEI